MQKAISLPNLETTNPALRVREQLSSFSFPVYVHVILVASDIFKELVDNSMTAAFREHKVLTSLELLHMCQNRITQTTPQTELTKSTFSSS